MSSRLEALKKRYFESNEPIESFDLTELIVEVVDESLFLEIHKWYLLHPYYPKPDFNLFLTWLTPCPVLGTFERNLPTAFLSHLLNLHPITQISHLQQLNVLLWELELCVPSSYQEQLLEWLDIQR